ncbi:ATP-binding cassette domain-containing protein [Methanosarcina horonobensis]|uniref:ATP-binding cassette domain-containing protein n=1 Tax=Methanosarcina horonobensis TaxID=418008 RepID=UPI000B068216|nr:ATP-binding cassette domain-containing protein [Methanosarcina horonobensis]
MTGAFKPPTYETFHALTDINFIVEEGEALGIIGENGSGKSTLLKIIANILRPSAGSVTALKKLTPFLELGVGFQSDLTASENIKIYATIMGMQKKEINDKMDDILKFAGLENFRDTKLKKFFIGYAGKACLFNSNSNRSGNPLDGRSTGCWRYGVPAEVSGCLERVQEKRNYYSLCFP